MRNCIRCNVEMIEDLTLVTNDGMGVAVTEKGLFKSALGKISTAVCPECGYVEIYMDSTDKVKN